MRKSFYTVILFLFPFLAFCQKAVKKDTLQYLNKKYSVTSNKQLNNLVKFYSANFKQAGYRVQICSESDKRDAERIKAQFLSQYDSCRAYESYQAPNFKIRVGDFLTRMEAYGLRKKIQATFPAAFVVAVPEIKFGKEQ